MGVPLLCKEESEVVIMIGCCGSKRRMGRIETSDLKLITSEPTVGKAKPSTRAIWRSSLSACRGVEKKGLTAPALLETPYEGRGLAAISGNICSAVVQSQFSILAWLDRLETF